jgi:hypothetical protein
MNKTVLILCASIALFSIPPAVSGAGDMVPADKPKRAVKPEESDRIMKILKARGIEMYKKFSGVESVRTEVIREYDPATGTLKSTSEVKVRRRDYYYKEPEIEVMSYKKDGNEMKPSKFRVMKSMPSLPVFDEQGEKNYSVVIEDTIMLGGKECYRARVSPKIETMRHFSGNIYFKTDTLQTAYLEGTTAKLDFPLKSFRIELQLVPVEDVPVVQSGKLQVRVNVPVFYPDTMIETSFTVLENRLLQ